MRVHPTHMAHQRHRARRPPGGSGRCFSNRAGTEQEQEQEQERGGRGLRREEWLLGVLLLLVLFSPGMGWAGWVVGGVVGVVLLGFVFCCVCGGFLELLL